MKKKTKVFLQYDPKTKKMIEVPKLPISKEVPNVFKN